jgi:Protein of unknown function (DUF3168)
MAAPAAELQKAVLATLGADRGLIAALGGAQVYELPPPKNAASPYVTFGRTSVYDWTTGSEKDGEQLLTLHIWSKAKGEAETLEIMDIIRARLADSLLPLDDSDPVRLRLEFSEARYDDDLVVHHGLLRFRAVTEPAAV